MHSTGSPQGDKEGRDCVAAPSGSTPRAPTSVVLNDLLGEAPAGDATIGWLMGRLGDRSFGIVLLLLGLLGLLPGVSAFVGVLLMVPAFQMILARPGPVFPQRIASRRFETRRLARVINRTVPVLRYLERFIRPRWVTPFETTKRVVGGVVLLLGGGLLAPIPLSNVPHPRWSSSWSPLPIWRRTGDCSAPRWPRPSFCWRSPPP